MTPDEFRRSGHALVEWIASYRERIEELPVLSQAEPGELRARLPSAPPETGESFEKMLSDVEQNILPGITHWQSPNFFAFFPANSTGPAILGELLSAGLGVQGMSWVTSPACTELETHVLDWLVDMLALPEKFKSKSEGGGVIHDSASSAVLVALLVARERATRFTSNRKGVDEPLVAYASSQVHSSVSKAVKIAGIGSENLRLIEVDDAYAMKPDALARRIEEDRKANLKPFFVCATVGSTSSTAIDPLPEIGRICRDQELWLHVDAALAGAAGLVPELRHIHDGVELADSYCFNPHKWLFTSFDCDCFYVADRGELIETLTVLPEYLRNQASDSGTVIDYRDWQIPLGRRFRALKLWFVIRHYGVAGLRHHIAEHVALAQELAHWVRADDRFELVAPVPLNLVCFRLRASDARNEELMNRVNASGRIYMTHAKLRERFVLRLAVGQTHTQKRHVEAAWKLIQQTATELGPDAVTGTNPRD